MKPCKICKALTESVFNIAFKAVHICEDCAASIFSQQAVYYVNKDRNEIHNKKNK